MLLVLVADYITTLELLKLWGPRELCNHVHHQMRSVLRTLDLPGGLKHSCPVYKYVPVNCYLTKRSLSQVHCIPIRMNNF